MAQTVDCPVCGWRVYPKQVPGTRLNEPSPWLLPELCPQCGARLVDAQELTLCPPLRPLYRLRQRRWPLSPSEVASELGCTRHRARHLLDRLAVELQRPPELICALEGCDNELALDDPRQLYCSGACKQADYRRRLAHSP